MLSPLDRLDLQLETLLELDPRGRIVRPPRLLFLGRTPEGQRLRVGAGLPDDVVAELEMIARRLPRIRDLDAPPPAPDALRAPLDRIESAYRGPAFWLPEACDDPGAAVLVTAEDVTAICGPFDWLVAELESASPAVVAIEDGVAVAVCHCAARGPRAAEAGVETVESARRRGHARRAVAAWSAHVRARGLQPLYSTWWENAASLALARSLGAVPYAEDYHLS